MNKFLVLFLTLSGCAPHYHVFNRVESDTIKKVEEIYIQCLPNDKIFVLKLENSTTDEVLLCTNTINAKYVSMQKDTIKNGYLYKFEIGDTKFHRLLNNDSLIIKSRVNNKWIENKFVPKKDRYIK